MNDVKKFADTQREGEISFSEENGEDTPAESAPENNLDTNDDSFDDDAENLENNEEGVLPKEEDEKSESEKEVPFHENPR